MLDPTIALTNVAVVASAMFALWLLSLRLRDSSIVDLFWGPGFVLVAWVSVALEPDVGPRGWLTVGLVTIWGLRLGAYLTWRNHGRGEDPRYRAMREKAGERWPLRSLMIVFGLQGALMLIISLPVQVAIHQPSPHGLGPLEIVGAATVLVGVGSESVADWQLARFRAEGIPGRVMDRGLWRYSRHPNYFGDFLVWWGLYLVAASTGVGAWTALSPIVMSVLLMRVSGVPLLEASMKNRPGYAEYVRRTSAFFPWWPRT